MFNIRSLLRRSRPSTSSATVTSPDSSFNASKFHSNATHPLVSALIVFNDAGRLENLRSALRCFGNQRWPYKEAVVINSTDLDLRDEVAGQRTFKIKAKFLGELKNLALYNALGEWCFPWPDDCELAPEYMSWHMHRRSKAHPTVISNPLGAVLKDGISHTLSWEIAPFISFFRFGPYVYDQDGSDVRFINKYPDKNLAQAEGGLVCRFFEDYAD